MAIVLTTRQYVDVAIRGVKEVYSSDEDVFAVVRQGEKVRVIALSEGVAKLSYRVGNKYKWLGVEVNVKMGRGINIGQPEEQYICEKEG
jgi:hypothetical protein